MRKKLIVEVYGANPALPVYSDADAPTKGQTITKAGAQLQLVNGKKLYAFDKTYLSAADIALFRNDRGYERVWEIGVNGELLEYSHLNQAMWVESSHLRVMGDEPEPEPAPAPEPEEEFEEWEITLRIRRVK